MPINDRNLNFLVLLSYLDERSQTGSHMSAHLYSTGQLSQKDSRIQRILIQSTFNQLLRFYALQIVAKYMNFHTKLQMIKKGLISYKP